MKTNISVVLVVLTAFRLFGAIALALPTGPQGLANEKASNPYTLGELSKIFNITIDEPGNHYEPGKQDLNIDTTPYEQHLSKRDHLTDKISSGQGVICGTAITFEPSVTLVILALTSVAPLVPATVVHRFNFVVGLAIARFV
ncbi:hypothetical protein H072_4415 [Dactylellina haptotyla CBS 200.50]|uniref:Uncharacterized protein n=1 Tax=Dactylellina haptotyla (strain CBS 200.50) TaxID=1284197 RepID=S8AKP3_DACHA|nr:hypothetical protein H072_4415 [Dactylellina haptotyla CBS 200.50]